VVAAPAEAEAVLAAYGSSATLDPHSWTLRPVGEGVDLVVSGVGKANAAGAVARLLSHETHGAVVSVGIAGALPGSGLQIGSVVCGTSSAYADEGSINPDGFTDIASMGFPPLVGGGCSMDADREVLDLLRPLADTEGVIATVSTCSGTDLAAVEVEKRTGAVCEAMEGAAVVQTARRLGLLAGELRVISNTTGDRSSQVWNLRAALDRLSRVIGLL